MQILQPEQPASLFIRSMNSITVKVGTKDHRGTLQLNLKFDSKVKTDIKVSCHTHAKVSLDDHLWQFEDKTCIVLKPAKAFDESLLTAKQLK